MFVVVGLGVANPIWKSAGLESQPPRWVAFFLAPDEREFRDILSALYERQEPPLLERTTIDKATITNNGRIARFDNAVVEFFTSIVVADVPPALRDYRVVAGKIRNERRSVFRSRIPQKRNEALTRQVLFRRQAAEFHQGGVQIQEVYRLPSGLPGCAHARPCDDHRHMRRTLPEG